MICKLVPADSCDDQDDLASSLVMRLFELIEEANGRLGFLLAKVSQQTIPKSETVAQNPESQPLAADDD